LPYLSWDPSAIRSRQRWQQGMENRNLSKLFTPARDRYELNQNRFHLLPLIFGAPFIPASLFIYGWTAEFKVHWIVPILATGLTGIGFIFSFVSPS
jgi:hypothetical protein